jgi:hypothetical protein
MQAKKLIIFIVLLSLLSISLFGQSLDKPLATVRLTENVVITQRQFQSKIDILEKELGITLNAAQKQSLLDSEIDTELIMQAAVRDNISATNDEVFAAIQQQKASLGSGRNISDAQFTQLVEQQMGMTWSEYQDRLKRRIIQEKYIAQNNQSFLSQPYNPAQKEIESVYEDNAAEFVSPAYVRFEHLFIDTRQLNNEEKQNALQRLEAISQEIRSGGNKAFQDYLQSSLDDPGISGGDFGFLPKNEQSTLQVLGQDFINSAFGLSIGQFSTVLTSNVGLHIIKITDKRSPKLLGLNDPVVPGQNLTVRQQITQYIQAQKQQERLAQAIENTTEALRAEADIRIFNQNITW